MNSILMSVAICGVAASVVALFYVLKTARAVQVLQASETELQASMAALIREFASVEAHVIETSTQASNIEQSLTAVSDRVERVELRGETRPFDSAIASARNGTDAGKLAQAFGLSATEARLMSVLHGKKKSA